MNIQHSCRSDRWYTPMEILHKVKEVLGSIDVDPASEDAANGRVGAKYIIGKDGELETTVWFKEGERGSVFLNPPGGRKGNRSMTGLFWKRLILEREKGTLTHAIFLCFSVEALQHTQRLGCLPITEFPMCIPSKRIAFDYPDGSKGAAPSHSNAIIYVPGSVDARERFREVFTDLGAVFNMC